MSGPAPIAATRPLRRSVTRRAVALGVAAALVLAACGDKEETLKGELVKDGYGCSQLEVDRRTDVPTVEAGTEVGDATKTTDEIVGEGCDTSSGAYLTLDMVGAVAADGKVFRNTFADGESPLTVRIGQGRLLAGLETGLADMLVGGRRTISVPAAEAYGATGDASLGIPADADLVFVVDLVAVTDAPKWCAEAAPIAPVTEGGAEGKPTEVNLPAEPVSELVTTDLTEGTGEEAVEGSYVEVRYLGVACDSGLVFDNNWDAAEDGSGPKDLLGATLGERQLVAGFENGLLGAKAGGIRQIDIPAAQAYGTAGREPDIGPNDPLTFVVEIVSVADAAPASTTTSPPVVDGDATTTTEAPAEG